MVESVSSNVLSIITARKGSKGLPNKNIRYLNDKMVFEYTVDYSLTIEKIIPNHTVISTDSDVIIDYCKNKEISYIERNSNLSTDTSRIEDVIYDVIIKENQSYDYISLLYADLPTRYPQEFKKSYDFLNNNMEYDCVMSFNNVKEHPKYMFKHDECILELNETSNYRRQELPKYIIHNGHTVLFRCGKFKEFMESNEEIQYLYQAFGKKIKPMIMDKIVIQINDMCDFKLVESVI